MQTFLEFRKALVESSQQGSLHNTRSKSDEIEVAKMAPLSFKFNYQGWTFEPSVHAAAQSYDRRPQFEVDDWKRMHRNVLEGIKKQGINKDGDYLFYSKSADQAYVTSVNLRRKTIKIVTVLPKSKSFPKPGTEKMVVENVEIFCEIVFVD